MASGSAPDAPRNLPEPSVVPRGYHDFYRTPGFRWWHSVAALALLVVGWWVVMLTVTVPALLYELQVGRVTLEEMARRGVTTPAVFLANNVGVALVIPVAIAAQRLVFGQRAGWLFSIQGRLRWGLLARLLLVAAAVHLAVLLSWLGATGGPDDLRIRSGTWFLLGVVVLTTPLQGAGEEVAFRGLATRAVGSWFTTPRVGLVVATAVTALVFMLSHGAADPWLNVFYLSLALTASLLTWRAGGLEGAIALHVVVNLTTMLFLPFLGLGGMSDRGPGAGGSEALAQLAALLLSGGALLWQIRRIRVPVRAAPPPPGPRAAPRG